VKKMPSILACADLRKATPWLTLLALMALIFSIRLMILNKYEAPPSGDLPGDLTVLDAYISDDPVHPEYKFQRPPIPFLLVLFPLIKMFPLFLALKIYDALLPTLVALPFFLICKEVVRSDKAALISTVLFAFTADYNEIVGWGGARDVLGIFFMLFSLYYLIKVLKYKKKLYAVTSGILLSLTVGTHHLTAVYYAFVLMAILGIAILTKLPAKHLFSSTVVGAMLSLPYGYTYLYMLQNRINIGLNNDFLEFLEYISINLPRALLFRDVLTYISIYSLSVIGFVLMTRFYKHREINVVVISLLVALVPLFFLLPIRGKPHLVYYSLIPAFLLSAFSLDKALCVFRRVGSSGRLMLGTLLFIIISIQVRGAYSRLVDAVDWYQVLDNDSIEALDWISKNIPKGATLLACDENLNVWIEGYARRRALGGPKPLDYYVVAPEYEKALVSNIICLGNYVMENGYIMVVDEFPHGYYTPGIFMRTFDYQVPLIYFYDEVQTVKFSTYHADMLSSTTKVLENASLTSNELSVRFKYGWSFGNISRIVVLPRSEPRVRVIYDVDVAHAPIDQLDVRAIVDHTNKVLKISEARNGSITLNVLTGEGKIVEVNVSLISTSSPSYNITYDLQDPLTKLPTITFTFKPKTHQVNVVVEVFVKLARCYDDKLSFWDSNELLKMYGIKYVVVDKKASYSRYVRFIYSPAFSPIYENQRILVLKVDG